MAEDASWGNMFYYWGNGHHSTTEPSRNTTWGEEFDVERLFGLMKTKFVGRRL
jgi:endoglucanase